MDVLVRLGEVLGGAAVMPRDHFNPIGCFQRHEHHEKLGLLFWECLLDEIGHVCLISVSLPCRFPCFFFNVFFFPSSSRFYGFSIFLLFVLRFPCVVDVPLFCFDFQSCFFLHLFSSGDFGVSKLGHGSLGSAHPGQVVHLSLKVLRR